VLVDDALAGGLVELLARDDEGGACLLLVARGDGLARGADGGLDLAANGLVALGGLLVGQDALDLRLDVCQVSVFLVVWIVRWRSWSCHRRGRWPGRRPLVAPVIVGNERGAQAKDRL